MTKIYYDLKYSDYILKYKDFTLYFSSPIYLEKFNFRVNDYIENKTNMIKSKYNENINLDPLLIIQLYKSVEKRGFRVDYKSKPLKTNYNFILNLK